MHISDHIVQQALETNAFMQSGILTAPTDEVQAVLNGVGDKVTFPFWNDLIGSRQIISTTGMT